MTGPPVCQCVACEVAWCRDVAIYVIRWRDNGRYYTGRHAVGTALRRVRLVPRR